MSLMGTYQVFLAGFAGGAVLELMHWFNLRRKPSFPKYCRSIGYWIITVAMACVGGLLAVLYFGDRADAIVVFHVGLSTPLILQKLTTTVATAPGAKGDAGWLDFFRW
jgi:hypothetical protein